MEKTPNTAAQTLATFAAELDYANVPPAVAQRAKDCIVDTVAAATFGAQFDWSRIVVEDYARRYGSGGACSILGFPDLRVHAPYAALANGVLAHAFELDGPGSPGTHPGATRLPRFLLRARRPEPMAKPRLLRSSRDVKSCLASASHRATVRSSSASMRRGFWVLTEQPWPQGACWD